MNTQINAAELRTEKRETLLEIVTAIVLGIATIGAAFAAYQASLYSGSSLDHYSMSLVKTANANAQTLEASQSFIYDMITWLEYESRTISASKGAGIQAKVDGEVAKVIEKDFLEDRMKAAIAWAKEESKKSAIRLHPTDSEDYAMELLGGAVDTETEQVAEIEKARKDNSTGDKFTLSTVLFTIVLFFTGIAAVMRRLGIRTVLISIATLFLAFAVVHLLSLPLAG